MSSSAIHGRSKGRKTASARFCGCTLVALATVLQSGQAFAAPATTPANFSQTTAGAISTTVPDGICAAVTSVRGGSGASSGIAATNGGIGGAGAEINARFNVLPGQAVTGMVASGGQYVATMTGVNNGTGTANGGSSGTTATGYLVHRGGGGGGSSSLSVAGIKMVEAGGGGGGGASHSSVPVANGGGGGFSGIAPGVVAPGIRGVNGADGAATLNGGNGGAAAAGGAGGTNSANATLNGLAGGGIGTGTGGNSANDPNTDSGGAGGGGYTGGGGGASTVNTSTVSGGGGGGGSSFLRGTSPTASAPAPTAVSGAAGPTPAAGSVSGIAGLATVNWVACDYALAITKSASATSVNAGQAVRWTITVRNSGTEPMTKGDTVTLTDTLPTGGGSTFRVVSIGTTAGSTDPNMASGAITCTGLTVGGTMPASTECSRPYSASSAPGAPSGGTRGLNAGETLTIVYDQIFNNAIPAASITNQASVVDRAGTKSASASTSIVPYDLRVTKAASATLLPAGGVITWTVTVTNQGPGAMFGPDATVANPLTVSDAAPVTNASAPVSFTSSGPAGSCTYASGTITCPSGLPLNGTQTFTFQQTINAGTAPATSIVNSASVTDYTSAGGEGADSASATVTVQGSADLRVTKSNGVSSVVSGSTVTYTVVVTNAGPDPVTGAVVTDVVGAGLTCSAASAVTITGNGVPAGSFTIANLTGAGITLGTLNSGQSATLTYSCQVN